MELIFFVFIIALPFLLIYNISKSIKSSIEGKSIFKGKIIESRANYLLNAFGLKESELRLIHFDGRFFHLNSKILYTEVSSITCLSSEYVKITNPAVPHLKSWAHTRVDGLPDRRYSSNPVTRTSTRFKLLFRGTTTTKFDIYDKWSTDAIHIIEKINVFLGIAKEIEMEQVFNEYEVLLKNYRRSQSLLKKKLDEKVESEKILSISQRLPSQDLPLKTSELLSTKTSLETEISNLQTEVLSSKNKLTEAIQNMTVLINQYKDKQIVQEYYLKKAAG